MDVAPILRTSTNTLKSGDPLLAAAQELEASFLAEMLKAAGLGESSGAFGGGAGEDQFASFLVQEHARAIVKTGGIGLSEYIYESLKEKNDADIEGKQGIERIE